MDMARRYNTHGIAAYHDEANNYQANIDRLIAGRGIVRRANDVEEQMEPEPRYNADEVRCFYIILIILQSSYLQLSSDGC
jgi:hypothetical protein